MSTSNQSCSLCKEDRAPWYVIVFRIVVFLVIWLLGAAFIFCSPFWADSFCMYIFDSPDPLFFNFFMDHQWLFYVWAVCSAGLSFFNIVRSVSNAFFDF